MLPSECPYPPQVDVADAPSHPLGFGVDLKEGSCTLCGRWVKRCPDCSAANRWLARFCRQCGHGLEALNWVGESVDSPLAGRPFVWPRRWQLVARCGFLPRWSGLLDGRWFVLGRGGELRCLARDPWRLEPAAGAPLPPTQGAGYLHGFLVLPGDDSLAFVDLNPQSGGPASARRSPPLRGTLLCPVACDQGHWLAALVQDGERRSLQLFRLMQGRLTLAWSQAVASFAGHPDRIPRLIWCDETLIYLREDGELTGFEPAQGSELFRLSCNCPPSALAPWTRRGSCNWAGNDGSLWWLRLTPQVQLHQVAPAQPAPVLALTGGPNDLLASSGRVLRRVHLESGRHDSFELPHYCVTPPWVGDNASLVLCQEGQVYGLSLGTTTFQVTASDKLPAPFVSSSSEPVFTGREWLVCDSEGQLFLGQ